MTVRDRVTSSFVLRGLFAVASCAAACSSGSPRSFSAEEKESNAFDDVLARAVLTQHNDNARTGAILSETVLNTSNVNEARFGKIASLPVRGSVTAQPLYVPNLDIDGATHNVVYIATMHNFVYAFPGDGSSTTPLWGPVSLGSSIPLPDDAIANGVKYKDTAGEVGIVSTPVISWDSKSLFVVATRKESGRFFHSLHCLDLRTGRPQIPEVVIEAPELQFQSELQNQRSALLLANDTLYVSFAAYGDENAYRGFMFAYDATTLRRRSVFRTTETGEGRGGIWMAGQGPAADSEGNVYAITANGQFTPNEIEPLKTRDLGDSFIKLSGRDLALESWFSPANNADLNGQDGDLGASGAMLIPNTKIVLGAGKEGKFFLLDRTKLGYFDSTAEDKQPGVIQRFFATPERCKDKLWTSVCHHVHGSPVYWDGPKGPWIYVWPENDYLKAFKFDPVSGKVDCGKVDPECTTVSESDTVKPEYVPGGSSGMPGGFLSLSANGQSEGSGIVWGLHPYRGNANQAVVEGILRAYDAGNLKTELWNSRMNQDRDDVGPFAKTAAPTIADGSVYVPSFAGLSRKITLTEQSAFSPALAASPSSGLYFGWTEKDGNLSISSSTNGLDFSAKTALGRTSITGPALAVSDSALFLGFVASDGRVNVVRSTDGFATSTNMDGLGGATTATASNEAPDAVKSSQAPALALSSERVFLAWTAADGALSLISGASDGSTFDAATKVAFGEQSKTTPDLAYQDNRLYVAWTDPSGNVNVAYSIDNGRTLFDKQTLAETSNSGPRILSLAADRTAPDLHVFWADPERGALSVKTAEDADIHGFRYRLKFQDASESAPAATVFKQHAFIGWTDSNGALNVARYSSGEISVYGLLNRR